jgi:hypothetical protein
MVEQKLDPAFSWAEQGKQVPGMRNTIAAGVRGFVNFRGKITVACHCRWRSRCATRLQVTHIVTNHQGVFRGYLENPARQQHWRWMRLAFTQRVSANNARCAFE